MKNLSTNVEVKQEVLDSREVAEMIGKRHSDLLRDIRKYIEYLAKSNIALSSYFNESKYLDKNKIERPNYLISKKGCEFIAHKLTGEKGSLFTIKYIEKFHEMENTIRNHIMENPDSYMIEDPRKRALKWIEEETERVELRESNEKLGSHNKKLLRENVELEQHNKNLEKEKDSLLDEVEEFMDGNNRIQTAKQLVDKLKIPHLTTTILHEWFCSRQFGEMKMEKSGKKRYFAPNENFFEFIAKIGCSFTGTTVKGDKVKIIYDEFMFDRIVEFHYDSLVEYVEFRTGKKIIINKNTMF